ncbi:hypothetical protein [Thermanaeromonas toyohensis]|uniref:hypothetical protein n=1 Tax=Thermanaeromonas toyohensis TaxID=161154 RepID=UPI0012F4EE1F|nr:hypothetical protein [Thermanaeromonas toyohensis]
MRTTPPQLAAALARLGPFSAIADSFTADKIACFLPVLLPYAIGLDLAIWTVGLLLWLGSNGYWPGAALGSFLSLCPSLAWIVVVTFTLLGGLVIVGIAFLFYYITEILLKSSNTSTPTK